MRVIFFLTAILSLSVFSFGTFAKPLDFKLVKESSNLSLYENADKNIQVVKRKQKPPLKNLKLDKKSLKELANNRFESLKSIEIGFHNFKIIKVYTKPVRLNEKEIAYVWSGSYADKSKTVHFC